MSGRTTHHSLEERLEVVLLYLSGQVGSSRLAKQYGVSGHTVQDWVHAYRHDGVAGLKESHTWRHYSPELKWQACQDYLSGKYSVYECCDRYNISSHSVLRGWLKRYTSGKTFTEKSGGSTRMKAKRKVTQAEREEVVTYALKHGKNYQATADKFNVSYQQVYNWGRKFEKDGSSGLVDRRGQRKKQLEPAKELTEVDRLKLENERLKQEKLMLEAENFILKKVGALRERSKR
ncbi:transposase [Ligilactobacillus salivarius]